MRRAGRRRWPGQLTSRYAADEFRTSDHDPVVVDLHLYNVITGTSRRDTLVGTDASDRIIGGGGPDLLTGLGGLGFTGGDALAAGWVRVVGVPATSGQGAHCVVQIDTNGPGAGGYRTLIIVPGVTVAELAHPAHFIF